MAVVPDEHRCVYVRIEVVPVEKAPAVFLGPGGEFVELPILEVSDLRGHWSPPYISRRRIPLGFILPTPTDSFTPFDKSGVLSLPQAGQT